jgi:hypothetical protein
MDPAGNVRIASIGQVHSAKLKCVVRLLRWPLPVFADNLQQPSFTKPSPVLENAPTNLRVLVWNGLSLVSIRCGSRSGHIGKKNHAYGWICSFCALTHLLAYLFEDGKIHSLRNPYCGKLRNVIWLVSLLGPGICSNG